MEIEIYLHIVVILIILGFVLTNCAKHAKLTVYIGSFGEFDGRIRFRCRVRRSVCMCKRLCLVLGMLGAGAGAAATTWTVTLTEKQKDGWW